MTGPGKAHREGISLIKLTEMFPDETSATAWFESLVWPSGRHCPRCGSLETTHASVTKKMPYWCGACRKGFSVRIGTAFERSRVPLRKWVFAIYLEMTSLKGVSSMKLHRDLSVTQKTAWFMLHRIREAWIDEKIELFSGPVEADETYMGGREKNKHKDRKLNAGRGPVGKTPVVGVKDRASNKVKAQVITDTRAKTLQGFVTSHTTPCATVYTDDAITYVGIKREHESVKHSVGEYVNGMAHTNGVESFWATLKRAHKGVYHKISPKHLDRYVQEFAGRHNVRPQDTIDQMGGLVRGMSGKRLKFTDVIADNGLDSGARL